uniref:protein-tyrosine-phosphatase n=1 Tax=Arcella intermedia TaxID=1963864 RepID=A0A6B2LVM2_9EUKA
MYLGSYTSAKNLEGLKERNITEILTLGNLPPVFSGTFNYKVINISDVEIEKIDQYFSATNEVIDAALGKNTSILVHCAGE